MALLLGIDLGTSYFKAGLFDLSGRLRGLGRVAAEKSTPAPGRCEMALEPFWRSLREAVQAALQQAGAMPQDISGMSYSSQASTFVLLDGHDQPLTPLISWLDTRGEGLEPELAAFAQTDRFQATIGFRGVGPHAAVAKWRWYQRAEPALWARTRRAMTISDYFSFSLTGERVGDAGTAAFLGLLDLRRCEWWPEALAAFVLEPDLLSVPLPPGTACGRTAKRAMELLGISAGIPFAVGSLDHHAGAIGAGLGRQAQISITTGTVLAALALVEKVEPKADCFHGLHLGGKSCYRLAFDPRGAGRLEDYQREFAPDLSIDQLLALAEKSDEPRGSAVRRILGEIAGTHRDLVARCGPDVTGPVLATGGGARSRLWLQLKANALGRPLVTSRSPEQGCLGAALFGAVAAGHFGTALEAQAAMTEPGDSVRPQA